MYTTIAMTGNPIKLETALGAGISPHIAGVLLQNPGTNSGILYFGDHAAQPIQVPVGSSSSVLPIKDTGDLYLLGTVADVINVAIFRN